MRQGLGLHLLTGVLSLFSVVSGWAQETPTPQTLLPADTAVLFALEGGLRQEAAYKETAAFEAYETSGLMPALRTLWRELPWDLITATAKENSDLGEEFEFEQVLEIARHIELHGIMGAVCLPGNEPLPWPYAVVVLPESKPLFERFVLPTAEDKFKSTISKTTVFQVKLTEELPMTLAMWTTGNHTVIAYGLVANIHELVKLYEGSGKSLTQNPRFQKAAKNENVLALNFWIDFARLKSAYGETPFAEMGLTEEALSVEGLPETLSANVILDTFGLGSLEAFACYSGYDGKYLVSQCDVQLTAFEGLFAQPQQAAVSLKDLPVLPKDCLQFTLSAADAPSTVKAWQQIQQKVEALLPEDLKAQWDELKPALTEKVGFDWQAALIDPLGTTFATYNDAMQSPISWTPNTFAWSVADEEAMKAGLKQLTERLKQDDAAPFVQVIEVEKQGYPVTSLLIRGSSSITYTVAKGWLVVAMQPQPVEAYLLRLAGRLPKWSLDDVPEATQAAIPETFMTLSVSDPRPAARFLVSLNPWVVDTTRIMAEAAGLTGLTEWEPPITALDIPPAELIVAPLFPNVTIVQPVETTLRTTSRSSTNLSQAGTWIVGGIVGLIVLGAVGG